MARESIALAKTADQLNWDGEASDSARWAASNWFGPLFSDNPVPTALLDADGLLLRVNGSLGEFLGHAIETIHGRRLADLLVPGCASWHDVANHFSADPEVASHEFEAKLLHRAGHTVPVRLAVARIADPSGEMDCYLVHAQDQSPLRGAERTIDQLRCVFDDAPEFAIVLQADGTIVDANRTALVIADLPLRALSGQPLWELGWWNPVEGRRLRGAVAAAAAGAAMRYEVTLRGPQDTISTIDFALQPIRDRQGQVVRLLATGRDVSQHKSAVDALRQSEALFRDAFDYAAIGMALTATDGRFVRVNRSFCQIVGYSEEELLRTTTQAITHPEDARSDLEVLRRLLADEISFYHLEKRFLHKDGHLVYGLESVSVANDSNNRQKHLLCQVQDITGRKLAEEAVRRDRDFAESLIETAQAIVLVVDAAERVIRFNNFTEQLTGFSLDAVRGQDWCDALVPVHARPIARRLIADALSGIAPQSRAFAIMTRDHFEHEIEWSGRALAEASGNIAAVLLIGHDITKLKETQQQLLEAERLAAIGQMSSGLAHESRNALQQIGACAEMLTMDLHGQPATLDLVVGVQDAADRLHRLFEDVRTYAVPQRLARTSANLAEVWRAAWARVVQAHSGNALELKEEIDGVDLDCAVCVDALSQALFNVFENAVEASTGPTVVEVRCADAVLGDRAAIAISIRDDGPGLTAEQQRRILEPFYTTKTRGTGLGMSIVKRIVEALGGRLEVPPQQPPGAELLILLPRDA